MSSIDFAGAVSTLATVYPECRIIPWTAENVQSLSIPDDWKQLAAMTETERLRWASSAWAPFAAVLPLTTRFIDECVKEVFLATDGTTRPMLLYAHTEGSGQKLYFYKGFPPLKDVAIAPPSLWGRVPQELQLFFETLHNGWTFVPAESMGPLPIQDWADLTSDRFDLDHDDASSMALPLEQIVSMFHNGGGDYLCLNFNEFDEDGYATGLIWWHEEPTKPEKVNFFNHLDAWMDVFLSDADSGHRT